MQRVLFFIRCQVSGFRCQASGVGRISRHAEAKHPVTVLLCHAEAKPKHPVTSYEYIDWIHRPCGTLDDVLQRHSPAGLWMTYCSDTRLRDSGWRIAATLACGTQDDILRRLLPTGLWMTIVNKKAPEDRGVNDACCLTAIYRLRLPTR